MTSEREFDKEFQIISSEYEDIIKLKHIVCGLEFEKNLLEEKTKINYCPICSNDVKNAKEIVEKFNELYIKEYKILDYIKDSNQLIIKHNVCGNTSLHKLDDILINKHVCLCKNKDCKKIFYRKKAETILGKEFELVGEYNGYRKKNLIKHKKCNTIFENTISEFKKRNNKCIECLKSENKDNFYKVFNERFSSDYKIIGDFINKNTFIKIKHLSCGEVFEVKPSTLLTLKTNNICPNKNCKKIDIKNKILSNLNEEYEIVNKSFEENENIEIMHKKCNKVFSLNIENLVKNKKIQCTHCKTNSRTEIFKDKLYQVHKEEYILLDNITDYKTYVNFKHNKCGEVFKATPLVMSNPNAKHHCTNIKCKLEEANKELINNVIKGEFKFIGFDIENNLKILHKNCNQSFNIKLSYFQRHKKVSCPNCRKQEHNNKQLLEIQSFLGGEYEIVSEYKGYYSYIDIKHKLCGTITRIKPKNIKNINRLSTYCKNSKCKGHIDEIKPLPKEYSLIEGDIYKINSKIKVKHIDCGNEFETTYKSFISKSGIKCDKCNLKDREERFKQKLKEHFNDEFELVGEYKGTEKYTLFKHNKCGTIFKLIPNDFFRKDKNLCPLSECGWTKRTLFKRMHPNSIKEYLINKIGNEYEILEIVNKEDLTLKIKHKECSNIFEGKYSNLIRKINGKCPHCNTKTELGKLMNILKNRYNNEFTVLKMSNITKFNKMIKLMHKNCGAHFITTTEDIINEKMKCSNKECEHNYLNQDNKNIIQYQDDAINKKRLIIEKKLNNEFMISDKYNGNNYILLDVTHKKCGHTQYISIHNLLNRKTNVKCDECFRKTKEENFKKEIKDKYILLSKYHNRNTNIKVKRIECGHIYETKVSYVLNDKRYMCPKCKLENKIKYVKDLLIRKNYLNFELIKYTNDKDIILKHLDCKEHIKVNLKTIQNGKLNCKSCNKNKKLIEFKMKVFNLVGDEYEVVDNKYDNSKQLIRIKHKECGNTHEYIARNFLFKNVRCPRCSKKTRWNTKTFKNELYLLTKGEFLLKSEYINSSTDVTLRHTKCNKLFNAKPGRFLKRLKCPHCTTNVQKLSHNEYLERFDSIHSDRLVLLSQYKSMNENVEVLHKECGGIFEDNSRRFLVSKYSILCTKCNKYIKDYSESNKEKFEKKLYKKFNGEYSLVSKYNGIKNRMEIKHNKCGNTFSMIGESILKSNSPCKFCNKK